MANRRKSLMPSENITLKNQQDEDINDDEEEKRRRVLGTLKDHIFRIIIIDMSYI
jgi:hypothetical protein